jgi:dihydroxy-acid dehydratase
MNTVRVSDAISMGTRGMCYRLQSGNRIADIIETVMGVERYGTWMRQERE